MIVFVVMTHGRSHLQKSACAEVRGTSQESLEPGSEVFVAVDDQAQKFEGCFMTWRGVSVHGLSVYITVRRSTSTAVWNWGIDDAVRNASLWVGLRNYRAFGALEGINDFQGVPSGFHIAVLEPFVR